MQSAQYSLLVTNSVALTDYDSLWQGVCSQATLKRDMHF